MEKYQRNSILDKLTPYDPLAKPDDIIEITEWHNGEGFDVDLQSGGGQQFHLSYRELKAINKLVKKLGSNE